MAARGWMWGAGEGQGPIIGKTPDISAREQGWKVTGITAGSAARPFRGRVTEGKKLTGGVRLSAEAAGAGRWAGVRERGAETGRCELDRRGSADARGPAGSVRVRAERTARAEALAVGSGA